MMPDFLKTATRRSAFVAGGDLIHVTPDIDMARIGQCKSKKAKGVYELMRTFRIGEQADLYQQGLVTLQHELSLASWLRGQSALSKKKGNSMLRGAHDDDEEEDLRRNPAARMIKRSALSDVIAEFSKAASALTKQVGLASGPNG